MGGWGGRLDRSSASTQVWCTNYAPSLFGVNRGSVRALEVVEVKAHDAGARQVSETVEQADEEDLDLDQREAALHVRVRLGLG